MLTFTDAIEDLGPATEPITAADVAAYLAKYDPKIAELVARESGVVVEKTQPGAADVHQPSAGSSDGKRRARNFLTTIAEVKGGGRIVAVPDKIAADVGKGDDDEVAGEHEAAFEKQALALKPIDDNNSHSPFPHDAGALANLRPDQTPRFLGALTDQERLPTRRVRLAGLTAIQDRVDHGKVGEMRENPPEKPAVVVRANGRNLIVDGHHRLAAAALGGARTAVVRFLDISGEDQAVKFLADGRQVEQDGDVWKVYDRDEDRWIEVEVVEIEAMVTVEKFDLDQQKVFGWASVTHIGGEVVVDKQDDIIEPEVLEAAAHDFVLYAREQGNMHAKRNVGRLIGSVVFTPEKFEKCGLYAFDPETRKQLYGWWIEFKTQDAETWKSIRSGELPEFSIAGQAVRIPIPTEGAGAAAG